MRTTRRVATGLMLGLALAACRQPAPGGPYFPLEAGREWTYDVRSTWENETGERETYVLRALGEASLDVIGPAWQRRSDSGVDYWLRADASGIYRVASKTDLDREPTPDAAPRFVLKAPYAVGTNWQAATTAYLLRRRQEFPPEIRHTHAAIPMNYTIAAVDETVEVRAGRWEGCLRVQGIASLMLFADPVVGWRAMPLTTTEWYCPGAGLVRLERHEPSLGASFLTGGSLTMELVALR